MDREQERRNDEGLRLFLEKLEGDEIPFGIVTQKGYHDLEKQYQTIEDRFHRWFVTGLVIFALLGMSCAAGFFAFSYVLGKIQDQRESFIHDNCQAQNERNTNTIVKLTDATNDARNVAESEAEKQRIDQSLEASIAIINALVPVQDCDMLVKVARGEAEAPPPEPKPKKP